MKMSSVIGKIGGCIKLNQVRIGIIGLGTMGFQYAKDIKVGLIKGATLITT